MCLRSTQNTIWCHVFVNKSMCTSLELLDAENEVLELVSLVSLIP